MEITIKLTDEEIRDILITAQEHGSGYWCISDKNLRAALDGEEVEIRDREHPDTVLGTLTRAGLEDAANRLAKMYCGVHHLQKSLSSDVFTQLCGDPSAMDAEAADCFVQAAVFNEIVYG